MYESFIQDAEGNVGELELQGAETVRSIKTRLRRAASRLGANLDIWDVEGRVYFQGTQPKRGRPRKSA